MFSACSNVLIYKVVIKTSPHNKGVGLHINMFSISFNFACFMHSKLGIQLSMYLYADINLI